MFKYSFQCFGIQLLNKLLSVSEKKFHSNDRKIVYMKMLES